MFRFTMLDMTRMINLWPIHRSLDPSIPQFADRLSRNPTDPKIASPKTRQTFLVFADEVVDNVTTGHANATRGYAISRLVIKERPKEYSFRDTFCQIMKIVKISPLRSSCHRINPIRAAAKRAAGIASCTKRNVTPLTS